MQPHYAFAGFMGKRVHLGVTGSIAAYKALDLLRVLQEADCLVSATLTGACTKFVTPLSFEALGASPVYTSMFDESPGSDTAFGHLEPGQIADVMVIVPASANTIAKLAFGLADDMLSCQALAFPGPKIVVVQDMDKPVTLGSYWGEVSANLSRALGCVGTITDGAIRDIDEMTGAGFKALARRLCVGHAHSWPVRWGCEVEVFGRRINHGDLIHADKHGFLVIPEEDQEDLLNASIFMDRNECDTMISAARNATGKPMEEILSDLNDAAKRFGKAVQEKFGQKGEW